MRNFLQEHLTAESHLLFSQNAPSKMFARVSETNQGEFFIYTDKVCFVSGRMKSAGPVNENHSFSRFLTKINSLY